MSRTPARITLADIGDNTPITLQEASDLYFRGIITPAALRAEHGRGMLVIFRIGRQDFTTLRFIRDLQERKISSGSTKITRRGPPSAAEIEASQTAARATFRALRTSLRQPLKRRLKADTQAVD